MSKVSDLSERLRFTLYPVPGWVDTVHHELDITEAKARALLDGLKAAGKVKLFRDLDGCERVAHAGNCTPPDRERLP